MATAAQIAANRANALKSTGPRTPEGKDASRYNALSHGMDAASILLPGEDPIAYERIVDQYCREFRPQSALEEFHLDTLVRSDWQRRRLRRTEAKLYRALLAEGPTPEEIDVAILRDSPTAKLLRRVFSQIASLERAFFRALNHLRRIRRERDTPLDTCLPFIDAAPAPTLLRHDFPGNEPDPAPKTAPPAVLDNPALRL